MEERERESEREKGRLPGTQTDLERPRQTERDWVINPTGD